MRHFWHQNGPFVLDKTFLVINHCYNFHLPMALFIVQKLKEILQCIQSYDEAPFLGPTLSSYLKLIFFSENLLMSLVSFIHAYLHAKNQSQILIYLSVKYWWFKNTEISLAKSHFFLYLRSRYFPNMQFPQDVNEP